MLRIDELEAEAKTPRAVVLDGLPKNSNREPDVIGTKLGRIDVLRRRAETLSAEVRDEYIALSDLIDTVDPGLNPANNALCRTVLVMKLLEMRTGQDVCASLFMDRADFAEKEESYLRRMFKLQQAGITALWKTLGEEEIG